MVQKISFFLLHRHYKSDIIIFTQQWDGLDKRIRVITDRVYYVYKGAFTGMWFTRYYRCLLYTSGFVSSIQSGITNALCLIFGLVAALLLDRFNRKVEVPD